jgi:rhamnosyl/mannosyltransferase
LVITHHSDIVRQKVLRHLFAPLEKIVYSRAARIISNSPTYIGGSPILQRYHQKVETIPMGLNLERYQNPSPAATEFAAKLREKYGQNIWLMVGRCVYYKGFDTAIRALKSVPGVLLIVGQGPMIHAMSRLAEREHVQQRVKWLGQVSDDELAGAYHAAKALWFPSNARSEAFGLVQVEAMASGCPVINTNIPHSGVPWVSQHERTGVTIPMHDVSALVGAANRLLVEPQFHESTAAGARVRANRKFDHVRMAERTVALYERLAERELDRMRSTVADAPPVLRSAWEAEGDEVEVSYF